MTRARRVFLGLALMCVAPAPALPQGGNAGQPASPASVGRFVLQFPPVDPQYEKFRTWAQASTVFRNHVAWLNLQLSLPRDIPIVFTTCGVINAFYNPAMGSITFCYEWINHRIEQVRAKLPRANDEAVTDAVTRSVKFVINHEVGHALVHQLSLPVLGREEDAADGFGAFILLERGGPQDAYSVLQGAQSFGQASLFEDARVDDTHSLNDQRYFNILCWMYGSDAARLGGYAQRAGLSASRQQWCPHEWAQLRTSWLRVLDSRLLASPTAAAINGPAAPLTLADNSRLQIAAGQFWQTGFRISSPTCRAQLDVVVLAGGQLDVETALYEQPAFMNWQSGVAAAEAVFRSARTRRTGPIDIPIRGPGDFVVVINNNFSVFTPKEVQASIRVVCP